MVEAVENDMGSVDNDSAEEVWAQRLGKVLLVSMEVVATKDVYTALLWWYLDEAVAASSWF